MYLVGIREIRWDFYCSVFPFHLYVPLACISFWVNDNCITLSLLISLTCWYNQKPFISLIGEGQMNDVGAVPPAAGETLEIF